MLWYSLEAPHTILLMSNYNIFLWSSRIILWIPHSSVLYCEFCGKGPNLKMPGLIPSSLLGDKSLCPCHLQGGGHTIFGVNLIGISIDVDVGVILSCLHNIL